MARWEPPKSSPEDQPRARRARARRPRRELPEIWLMAGARAAITMVLGAAVVQSQLREQMLWVVLALVAGLGLVARQSHETNTLRLRNQSIIDLAVLLAVLPLAVITGFVAAGTGELLPAERSVFLQASVATVIVLAMVGLLSVRLFAKDQSDIATMFLPASLIVISLPFVLHDYRNQTVLAMIAVSYFLGTAAIPFGIIVDEAVRRYIGLVFAGSTVLVGMVLFDPGLSNLDERAQLIQIVDWGIILLVLASLFLLPHIPALVPRLAGDGNRRYDIIQTIRDRRSIDSE